MGTALDFLAERLPEVTVDDVRRFRTVEIRDEKAFAAELQKFVREHFTALSMPDDLALESDGLRKPAGMGKAAAVRLALSGQAHALVADARWQPGTTEIQHGRAILLEEYNAPRNMPVPKFAELADRARQQIYGEIQARRLLSISTGPRKQKVPDWQLDQTKLALTRSVLAAAPEVDNWTIYKALSEPLASLDGRAPVDTVQADTVDKMTKTVLNVLGIIASNTRV